MQEVRGGGSYYSQNDLRVHFGLGTATRIERLEIRWPNGLEEAWTDVGIDRIVTLKEAAAAPCRGSRDGSPRGGRGPSS